MWIRHEIHTVSPGSPFCPTRPCDWQEIIFMILSSQRLLNHSENRIQYHWSNGSCVSALSFISLFAFFTSEPLVPLWEKRNTQSSCRVHANMKWTRTLSTWKPDPTTQCEHRPAVRSTHHLVGHSCIITLSPCRPCPGGPLGPEIPWNPGSP